MEAALLKILFFSFNLYPVPKINLNNQCRRSTEHKHTPAHATSNLVQITHIPTPTQPPIHIFTHMQLPALLPPSHTRTYATANLLASFTLY